MDENLLKLVLEKASSLAEAEAFLKRLTGTSVEWPAPATRISTVTGTVVPVEPETPTKIVTQPQMRSGRKQLLSRKVSRSKAPRWSQEEKEIVAEGARSRTPIPDIAAAIGRSVSAVATYISVHKERLGLVEVQQVQGDVPPGIRAGTHWTNYADERLHSMAMANMTDAQIAAQLGRTRRAITERRTKLGLFYRISKASAVNGTQHAPENVTTR